MITRRDSLKISAISAAALALGSLPSAVSGQVRLRWRGPEQEVQKEVRSETACELLRAPPESTPEAEAMAWIAQAEEILAARLGEFPLLQASCAADQAELLARAHHLVRIEAAVANTRGNIAQSRLDGGEVKKARDYFARAAELARKADDRILMARALVNAARVDLRQKDVAAAGRLLEGAINTLDGLDAAFERIAIAATYNDAAAQDTNRIETAFQAVQQARQSASAQDDLRLKSWGEGLAGELYAIAKRDGDALILLREAARLAEDASAPEIAYRWQWHSGRLLSAHGDLDGAIAAFEVARNNVDKVRLALPEFDPQTGTSLFRRTLGPIYTGLADLYLRKAKQEGSLDLAKPEPLINARQVVEQLKAAELDDYFGDACTAALLEQSVDLEEATTPGAAVLYPILLDDRTELVITLPDGTIRSARSEAGADEISELCGRLRASLLPPNLQTGVARAEDYAEPARALYRYLIAPLEPELKDVGTIVFVPDGPLRNIPIAALLNGDRFLVEDYAIGTTLGLRLLESAELNRKESRMLFAGIAEQIPNQKAFPPLSGVAIERDRIAEVLPPRQLLFDDAFKESAIKTEITERAFDIVHVATHGLFGARPEDSYILAWDDTLDMTEFENILVQTRFRDDPIDLLTLSACKTAEGNDRAALGIAGLAVKVGARSALASLWEAVDDSTAPMMADFYKYFVDEGKTKAISLQDAQRGIISSKDDLLGFGREVTGKTHPVYWASFIIVGSWV